MLDKVTEFIGVLRKNGVRVSLAENLDAVKAARIMGISSREDFKNAMRATLIKTGRDIPVFNELFDIYFSGLGKVVKDGLADMSNIAFMTPEEFKEAMKNLMEALANSNMRISDLTMMMINSDIGQIERMIQDAGRQMGISNIENFLQEGYFSRNLLAQMDWGQVEEELKQIMEMLDGSGMDADQRDKIKKFLEELMKKFPELMREIVRMEREKNKYRHMERFKEQNLAERSFAYLTEKEMREMEEVVRKLAQKLKTRITVRRKKARRGRFDLKRTLRKNLAHGGVPIEIVLDKKKRMRPQIMILCDVSDSVRHASRFMLLFIYSLQELFSKVRSFIFVSDLGEVTNLFRENEVNSAIEKALTGDVINVWSHSNFGNAFSVFNEQFLASVNSRTSVIIIGDGRNNYNDPKDWVLGEVKRKAKKLIWLNSESRSSWGFGDSEMDKYAPHCHMVEEVKNLLDLEKAIEKIAFQ